MAWDKAAMLVLANAINLVWLFPLPPPPPPPRVEGKKGRSVGRGRDDGEREYRLKEGERYCGRNTETGCKRERISKIIMRAKERKKEGEIAKERKKEMPGGT